jgi:FkbM family methyltransferase
LTTRLARILRTHIDASISELEARLRPELARLERAARSGRVLYLGGEQALAAHGVASFMHVDTTCLLVSPRIIDGTYEVATSSILRMLLSRGMHVIEIGANQGFHTLAMAEYVKPDGRIYAFEANPRTFCYLETNLASHVLHEVVVPYRLAAADQDGVAQFRQLQGYSAASHLKLFREDWTETFPGQNIEVETVDIARFVRSLDRPPDLVKIDAEGAEYAILRCLAPVLDVTKTDFVIEVIPSIISAVTNLEDFFKLIDDLGYRYWALRDERFSELTSAEAREIFSEDLVLSTKNLRSPV